MCSGATWEYEAWRPFTERLIEAGADADQPLARDPQVDSSAFFPGVPLS
jgi:hypothetical protein